MLQLQVHAVRDLETAPASATQLGPATISILFFRDEW
jgi:hypothetical protein